MNMIGCKCLNIIIETEVSNIPFVETNQLELTREESEDNFFQNENLRRVEKLDNINKSLPGLVETRDVGSWIVHYCINCKIHTHAVHKEKGASYVFANTSLLTSDAIKKLKNSENFSKAYGIVIDTSQFDDDNEDTFYPNDLEPTVKGLKQTLTDTMRKEAALVEDRIKLYTEEQYSMLDNLREKLYNEERVLIRNLLAHITTKPVEEKRDVKVSEANLQCKDIDRKSIQAAPSTLRHTPKRQKSTPVQRNYEPEFLFEFDGIDDNPLEKEDEVESEDVDDTQNTKPSDRYKSRNRTTSSSIKIAKSLPMDIPVFMRAKSNEETEYEEDGEQSEDGNPNVDIAASIKKLAKSVHGGGIFGELPRPRFSTQL